MTFNWQSLAKGERQGQERRELALQARRMTFPASFWSMVCSSLGFASLLIVPAKPLRQLGIGGVLGTVLALACAYLMYPAFLSSTEVSGTRTVGQRISTTFWSRRFVWLAVLVMVASFGLAPGLSRLNTDPSLLDYFKSHKPLRDELEYVDRNGGVNPLTLVITSRTGSKLDSRDEYVQMWALQNALERYESVGSVISLPVLLAEGKRHPLAFFLSYEHLLKILNEPKYGRIAGTFVTADRSAAAFYLRMKEENRPKPRLAVANDLRAIVRRYGFRPFLVAEFTSCKAHWHGLWNPV